MAEAQSVHIPRVKLGTQGLEVSKLGFGCMGLSGTYNTPVPEDAGISIIKEAFNQGITFFDTADVYGPHTNEVLLGKALKQLPREKIQLATKFGVVTRNFDLKDLTKVPVCGKPEYVRACCEASLKRLNVGELKRLVEEGKIKYIGLSEASADTIRRAHAVHPITAVQMEWSLWSRDIEEEIVPLCRELGIAVVAYGPLAFGLFAGKAVLESLPSDTLLTLHPRFSGENLDKNKIFYSRIEKLASKYGCTPAQLALAWGLNQGDDVVPILGTTKIKNLNSNIGALRVKLTKEEIKEISDAVPVNEVAGNRSIKPELSWKFADTPVKDHKIST
ncbi:unnamed protein product [Dovyalis caffra]|uniref:NADP-dependent oxidoreductase domain-containing protein n=1 Tax=Dovyalis caffra TaxID=77055 RepID=A0AAV1RZL8_9ROSI|nr:unnamed protein product [Dovyalis caffra]